MSDGSDSLEGRLSAPGTGQLQRDVLLLLLEHEDAGSLSTSVRFLSYELEQRGVISKQQTGRAGRTRISPHFDTSD